MSEYLHEDLRLVGRHTPDLTVPETDEYGRPLRKYSGFYELGVEVGGVFVPLFQEKAGRILPLFERAQDTGAQGLTTSRLTEPPPPAAGSAEAELERLRARVAELEGNAPASSSSSATGDTAATGTAAPDAGAAPDASSTAGQSA